MSREVADQCSALRDQVEREHASKQRLEMLLALDRVVVEFSMRMYNVSDGNKALVRKQNRRLHKMARKHFLPMRGVYSQ